MQDENLKRVEKCPYFGRCSQNLCPLDSELFLRTGSTSDKHRWPRGSKGVELNGRESISGGRVMPNAILKYVPESNLKYLNENSKRAWLRFEKENY